MLTLSFSLKPFFVALARFANDSTGQESCFLRSSSLGRLFVELFFFYHSLVDAPRRRYHEQ